MITFKQKGDFSYTKGFLESAKSIFRASTLDKYGLMGVKALMENTPVDTGLTASSWTYEIERTATGSTIYWYNTNVQNGLNIAIILQYGHATKGGHYVVGRDYINPAIQPVFDQIAEEAWNEVTK